MPTKRKLAATEPPTAPEIPRKKKSKKDTMPKRKKNKSAIPSPSSRPINTLPARPANNASFYQSGSGNNSVSPTQQNLGRLFDFYRDNPSEAPDKIGIEGAQKYLTDLNVELDEVAHLALCELLQCPSIGEFDREAFISGWRNVSTVDKPYDTTSRQAQYVNIIRKRLANDTAYFKQVYRNAFKLAKPETQRSVPMDSAVEFWSMFFKDDKGGIDWNSSKTEWLDLWCKFYEAQVKRPVNKDLWNMVGELVIKIKEPGGETLSWWTEDGAWPMAVDEFVAHIKERRQGEAEYMDTS